MITSYLKRYDITAHYAKGAILFIAYLLSAQVGAALFTAPAVLSPASGVALAGLILGGISLWPAILFAALVNNIINGSSILVTVLMPFVHVLQAVAGAYILQKLKFDPRLGRIRDMYMLMGVAFIASTIVPTLGHAIRALDAALLGNAPIELTWGAWWTGIMLSILITTPFVIQWFGQPLGKRSIRDWFEATAALALLLVIGIPLYFTNFTQVFHISLVYFYLIPLFWIALRIGPRFMTLAMVATAIMAIAGTFLGSNAPDASRLGERLFQVEIFVNILAVIFFTLVSVEEERKEAIRSLKGHISKLEDAFGKLHSQDRAKSEFIAVLAHELRNPLAPLVSTLELLRFKGIVNREGLSAIELMEDRIRTIKRLLDDLLDVSRISQDKLRLQKEHVDARDIVTRSIQSVALMIRDREQYLSVTLTDEPVPLFADPIRIEQVITNLLTNASKFTDPKGTITVLVRRDADEVVFGVRDSGMGIAPAMLSRIFEPFLQIELGKKKSEGLGIGLSLARRLVEMHDGTIEAKSEGEGRGSEFMVRLPLVSPPAPSTPEVPLPVEDSVDMPTRRSVLVVDDNMDAARGIVMLLEYKGYRATPAFTGGDAILAVRSNHPDIIVLDIGLPDLDGYEVAKRIRAEAFNGIIIALTGYGQDEDRAKAYAAGFNHHLVKPVGIADLEAAISELSAKETSSVL